MKYTPKFSRIQEIMKIFLRGRRVSMEELTERFNKSKRTIQRDIEYIRNNLNLSIAYDRTSNRYYLEQIVESIPSAKIFFTKDEISALRSAVDFLKKRKNFPLIKDLENFLNKIDQYIRVFEEYESIFEITDYVIPADFRNTYINIREAIHNRKYIEFEYYGSKEKKMIKRKVAPWFLIYTFGKWYLIGYCKKREEMRTFNLKKIKNLNVTNEPCYETIFEDRDKFKEDMLGPWKGDKPFWVSIFYDRESAKYIKEKYFPQEHKIKEFKDGSLRLKIKVSSLEPVLFYLVLPYHYHAEVEKPKVLKKKLIQYLNKTLEKYRE